ncbi:protein transport protein S31 [Oleoguttula sp. CCFEE 5521]
MVRLREISRTAVFAWSPGSGAPLLVTGTRTGAVNDDFSSETKIELWDLQLGSLEANPELTPVGSLTTDSGFNDIAWSQPTDDHPLGVIAGALDSGAVDLWDAAKLKKGGKGAHVSRTEKHSGAVKALQFNPYRHQLLASVGAKGEIFIYDLNNMANPFRLGGTAARADDIECLDWNKQEKTAHILATGSSGGFVTVWDVKQKKDILTLNNQGRKAVSAVAWDPEESTKLATATPNDQEPLIFLWSLRNSGAPERTLKGHELGVLGLSWCVQDPELLLSCGKDNKTICWNPRTGETYGDFAAGSNWAFQSTWNPHNPNLIASASFDGKILIMSSQSTNSKPEEQAAANQAMDELDFFAKAQTQPQGISFSISKTPKWAARPSSVSFGFGGKLVRVSADASRKSKVSIETYAVETSVGEATAAFEDKLKGGDLAGICEAKIENAKTEEEKADWQVIETLNAGKSRKKLREYLGFKDETDDELAEATEKLGINGDARASTNGTKDDDDFFGSGADGDNFLADLAATKGAKTNNPFSIYSGEESAADKGITRALMLGEFEAALEICLKEDRMSDAFMIAVCGGQTCIDKAQAAYLKKQAKGPNYLRLLASIVGKNLWDVVHNADLSSWKDVMATLCTYADNSEFSDLCEALGDRLEEAYQADGEKATRKDASFCYLAGSKLEKVVNNWVQELQEHEKFALESSEDDNDFAIHAQAMQQFIEKVSVFRQVANFQDAEKAASADWKLAPLYRLYAEYADILAAHGQLASAERYLDLLPSKFDGAESAQGRLKQATKKTVAPAAARQPALNQRINTRAAPAASPFSPANPLINSATNATPMSSASPYAPSGLSNNTPASAASPYAPIGVTPATPASAAPRGPYAPPANSYAPSGYNAPSFGQPTPMGGGYNAPQQASLPPPPRNNSGSPMPPPSAVKGTDWNDLPQGFLKTREPTSRRGTPAPVANPFPNSQPLASPPPPGVAQYGMNKPTPPLPPPPKAGDMTPRVLSPPIQSPMQRPGSAAGRAYAPPPSAQPSTAFPAPAPPPVNRGASPYQPPPSTSHAAPSNRYAPAPGSVPSQPQGGPGGPRNVAPNPYATQPPASNPYAAQVQSQTPYGQPQQPQQQQQAPPPQRSGPPPQGPLRSAPKPQTPISAPPPRAQPPPSSAATQPPPPTQPEQPQSPPSRPPTTTPRFARGDRTQIPRSARPILDLLTPEIARIKSVAPQAFKPQVDDMEKRINILFDHLNNGDLLSEGSVAKVVEISRAIASREWERAQGLLGEVPVEEGGVWVAGVKRMVNIGKATKG